MFARAATSRNEAGLESDTAAFVSSGAGDFSELIPSDWAELSVKYPVVGLYGWSASSTENVPQAGTYAFLVIILPCVRVPVGHVSDRNTKQCAIYEGSHE